MSKIIKIVLSVTLALSFTLPVSAKNRKPAAPRENESEMDLRLAKQALNSFMVEFRKAKTMKEVIAGMRPHFTQQELDFFTKRVADLPGDGAGLPQITRISEKELSLSVPGYTVSFEIISARDKIYAFNHHRIEFAELKTPQERWDAFEAAMPRHSSNRKPFLIDVLLPESHAFAPVIAGAIAAWPYLVAAGSALGAYIANDYYCNEVKDAADDCKPPLNDMNRMLDDFNDLKAKEEKKKKKAVLKCPVKDDEDGSFYEVEDAATTAYDKAKTKIDAKATQLIIGCGAQVERAKLCTNNLKELAKKLCMRIERDIKDIGTDGQKNQKSGGQ